MGKGVTQERIIFFILAVIFFGLVVFIFFKFLPSLITQIQLALGIIKMSNIEKATLCSIYRCIEGCMSMRVQELSWKEGDQTVHCQQFCTGEPYGIGPELPDDAYTREWWGLGAQEPSLRICNPKYPVIIKLKEKEKIEKSHLVLGETRVSDVRCVLSTDSSGPDILSIFTYFVGGVWQSVLNVWALTTGGTVSENILMIDQGIVAGKGNKEDCVVAGTSIVVSHDSFQQLTLDGGKTIKIASDFEWFGGINAVFTYMAEKDKYEQMFGS
jgi:hypothetical protein